MLGKIKQWNPEKINFNWRSNYQKIHTTKKKLSWRSKITHYKTVTKPEALYVAETLNMNFEGQMEKLE